MTALSPTVRLDPSVLQSVPSSIIPSADNTYDLGSSTNKWRNVVAGKYLIDNWDAVVETQFVKNGVLYRHQLIGTYAGWDLEAIYIAGYNANNSSYSTKRIFFGGGTTTPLDGANAGVVDLVKKTWIMPTILPGADGTYDLGSPTNRWRSLYVTKAVTGDVVFANGWRITEDGDALLFINPNGKPALKLKPDGTLERLK